MDMAGSLTRDAIQGPPPPPIEGGWGGDGGGGNDGRGSYRRASFTGLYVLLVASTMMFAAFTSAMVVRRGLGLGFGVATAICSGTGNGRRISCRQEPWGCDR